MLSEVHDEWQISRRYLSAESLANLYEETELEMPPTLLAGNWKTSLWICGQLYAAAPTCPHIHKPNDYDYDDEGLLAAYTLDWTQTPDTLD